MAVRSLVCSPSCYGQAKENTAGAFDQRTLRRRASARYRTGESWTESVTVLPGTVFHLLLSDSQLHFASSEPWLEFLRLALIHLIHSTSELIYDSSKWCCHSFMNNDPQLEHNVILSQWLTYIMSVMLAVLLWNIDLGFFCVPAAETAISHGLCAVPG